MLNNKEFSQAEELSVCLDHVNGGKRPLTEDDEIKKLVQMADLVKQSYRQEGVPQLMIEDLVGRLATELKMKKQQERHNRWLYGGLVGTAAAIFIASFGQFLSPQAIVNPIAQEMNSTTILQEKDVIAYLSNDPIVSQVTNAMIGQQDQSSNSAEIPATVAIEKKIADDFSKKNAAIIQVPELPVIDQKPNSIAMLQQEKPTNVMKTKNVLMAKVDSNSLPQDKKSQLESRMSILRLPNQVAQSITVDNTSHVIRQIYHQGTNDEIILTQRLVDDSMMETQGDVIQGQVKIVAEIAKMQTIMKDTKNMINSLTVKVDKYYVTIEGKKTKEELQKIAQSICIPTLN